MTAVISMIDFLDVAAAMTRRVFVPPRPLVSHCRQDIFSAYES